MISFIKLFLFFYILQQTEYELVMDEQISFVMAETTRGTQKVI